MTNRQLVYKFLELPYVTRHEIIAETISKPEAALLGCGDEHRFYARFLKTAQEKGLLDEVKQRVEKHWLELSA